MRSRPEGEAGFTLLEVLVAFVILTLVVTACLQVYSRSAEAEGRARWSERSHALLRDRLAAFETIGLQPGQVRQGQTGDGLKWVIIASQPIIGNGDSTSGRAVIWITARVTDPAGVTSTSSTARWRGEFIARVAE